LTTIAITCAFPSGATAEPTLVLDVAVTIAEQSVDSRATTDATDIIDVAIAITGAGYETITTTDPAFITVVWTPTNIVAIFSMANAIALSRWKSATSTFAADINDNSAATSACTVVDITGAVTLISRNATASTGSALIPVCGPTADAAAVTNLPIAVALSGCDTLAIAHTTGVFHRSASTYITAVKLIAFAIAFAWGDPRPAARTALVHRLAVAATRACRKSITATLATHIFDGSTVWNAIAPNA
jgi:hypothetical protein